MCDVRKENWPTNKVSTFYEVIKYVHMCTHQVHTGELMPEYRSYDYRVIKIVSPWPDWPY